jgi:CRISPR/Cas system CSM-associated protein Csm3 (group 7 of RAMP superfamily)
MVDMLDQTRFSVTLKLVSDLHIGAGETEQLSKLRPTAKLLDGVDPEVATIARDHAEKPVFPVTGLKGPLRRGLQAAVKKEDLDRLLGSIKTAPQKRSDGEESEVEQGNAGTVWLQSVAFKDIEAQPSDLPYWGDGGKQTWISTHVAIDRKTRTAADKNLFNVERVPSGARFTLSGVAFGANAAADILTVLAPLAASEGLALGSDERFGAGW